MKKGITAALLSGLIFPGFGQVYLGKKGVGLALIVATNIGLAGVALGIVMRLPLILEKIQPELEKGSLSFNQLAELILGNAGLGGGSFLEIFGVLLMAGSWLFAIGHAFHTGSNLGEATLKGK